MSLNESGSAKPNIVFILVDNVGPGGFSVYGGTTPTRSAILTGRHPVRSGTSSLTPQPGRKFGLLYGKWHVGDEQGRLPNDQGFDEWWGP